MYNFSSGKSLLPQHVFNIPGSLKLKHITTSTYEIEEWSFLGGPIVSRCLARFNTSKNLTRSILITPLRSPALRLITMILCQHLAYSSWLGHLLTNMSSSRLSLRSGKIARNTQYTISLQLLWRRRWHAKEQFPSYKIATCDALESYLLWGHVADQCLTHSYQFILVNFIVWPWLIYI